MRSFVVILCTATVLLEVVSGDLFPHAHHNAMADVHVDAPKKYKRDAIEDNVEKIRQCVSDKVDSAFAGNSSQLISDCKSAATKDFQMSASDVTDVSYLQSEISSMYRTFCIRECGDVVFKAYSECGIFELIPGTKELLVGLCGTKQHGGACYKLYGKGITLITLESTCYLNFFSSGECGCQSELAKAVSEQGCCVKTYHDFLAKINVSVYGKLYSVCNIEEPAGCNNSPFASG